MAFTVNVLMGTDEQRSSLYSSNFYIIKDVAKETYEYLQGLHKPSSHKCQRSLSRQGNVIICCHFVKKARDLMLQMDMYSTCKSGVCHVVLLSLEAQMQLFCN